MDNRKRTLQDYFDAARSEPGISPEELRAIVTRRRRRVPGGVAVVLVALLVAGVFVVRDWGEGETGERGRLERGGERGVGGVTAIEEPKANIELPGVSIQHSQPAIKNDVIPSVSEGRKSRNLPRALREIENPGASIVNRQSSIVNQSYIQETNMHTPRALSTIASVIALTSAATLSAQMQTAITPEARADEMIVREMKSGIGETIHEYWTPRLNDYRVRIDRMLSANDLEELNRLRVRFGVQAAMLIRQAEQNRGKSLKMALNDSSEIVRIFNEAKTIATRYRGSADVIGESVVGDISEFITVANQYVDGFVERNAGRAGERTKRNLQSTRQGFAKTSTMFNNELGKGLLRISYVPILEPLIMLYDGTELETLVRQIIAFSEGRGGGMLASSAIAGYPLPEASLLKQSAPNPAATSAAIGYALSEPSENTTLRLYDAKGELVKTFDEGARGAGEHTIAVDVSTLPPGTYLYRLTIKTSRGEQVSSKTMQVVR